MTAAETASTRGRASARRGRVHLSAVPADGGALDLAVFEDEHGSSTTAPRGVIAASACLAVLGSNAALAEWLGVSRAQPARWLSGVDRMSKRPERLVTDLGYVIDRARQVWSSEAAVRNWLVGSDPLLDGATPLDVVRLGDVAAVVKAIDGQLAGSYA